MALFFECKHSCVRIVLDSADIVRDRDLWPIETIAYQLVWITFLFADQQEAVIRSVSGSARHR